MERRNDGSVRPDNNGNPRKTTHRIVTLHDDQGNIIRMGYVIGHDYTTIKTFPGPWFADGGKVTKY